MGPTTRRECVVDSDHGGQKVCGVNDPASTQDVARRLERALRQSDLVAVGDLLDPGVTWGPPDSTSPPCTNKKQVLAWYRRGAAAGASAQVTEILATGDRILVGLSIDAMSTADEGDGRSARWQVYTVRDGLIVDIVGFDSRVEAAARAGVVS